MSKICKLYAVLFGICFGSLVLGGLIATIIWAGIDYAKSYHRLGPVIELASTDFTVLNITQTHLNAKWDVSIIIPENRHGFYICLLGDIQASILYKNITLATSSPQKCMDPARYNNPQLLQVSTVVVSNEDISGLIGKEVMEDIKDKKEVQFGFRFNLTDHVEKTVVMSYECDPFTLRFEPSSETKATLFGKHPKCKSF